MSEQNQPSTEFSAEKKKLSMFQYNSLHIFALFAVLTICLTIVGSSWFISQRPTVIRNVGTEKTQNGAVVNTLSVTGSGSVSAKPDMVTLNVAVSETKNASGEALNTVNEKINEILDISKKSGVNERDLTTTQLNIQTEYKYSGDERKIVGQKATQTVQIVLKHVDEKGEDAAKLIDSLSSISTIEIQGINFDIENKESLYQQARKNAFDQAKKRASESATLAGVWLGNVITINDVQVQTPVIQNSVSAKMVMEDRVSNTTISTGTLTTSIQIEVVFEINS